MDAEECRCPKITVRYSLVPCSFAHNPESKATERSQSVAVVTSRFHSLTLQPGVLSVMAC